MPTWKKLLYSGSDIDVNSVNIGTATDGTYTDGFFDTFNPNTRLGDAIDEISEAFLDLAPAKAGTLTGKTLTRVSPSTATGYIAGGLNSSDWYQGVSANQQVSSLVSATNLVLRSPSQTDTFRAGKNSDLVAGNLQGGVTASIEGPTGVGTITDTKALSEGTGFGSNSNIEITSIEQYNTFWAKANADLKLTLSSTGSYRTKISADNGAGETNESNTWYVGTGPDFPDVVINSFGITVNSSTDKFLSGISYYKAASLTLSPDVSNLFYPVYLTDGLVADSGFVARTEFSLGTPDYDDGYTTTDTTSLTNNKSSGTNLATIELRANKPLKTQKTITTVIGNKPVNTYLTSPSTSTEEEFLDEDFRVKDLNQTAWNSAVALTAGEAIVLNGTLESPTQANYSNFTSPEFDYTSLNADGEGYFNYYRVFNHPPGIAAFTFNFQTSNISSISPWGSGGDIEVALIKPTDTTLKGDFGRVFGDNSNNIFGLNNGGEAGDLSGNGTLFPDPNLSDTEVILHIRIKGTSQGKFNNLLINF